MYLIFIVLLSLNALSFEIKKQDCSAKVESSLVTISIEHHVSDFLEKKSKIKSKIYINTEDQTYELSQKILTEKKDAIEFKEINAPTIGQTGYRINSINLFDSIPDSSQDDFFFGSMINIDPDKSKYITDFSRFGGELVVIFYCKIVY